MMKYKLFAHLRCCCIVSTRGWALNCLVIDWIWFGILEPISHMDTSCRTVTHHQETTKSGSTNMILLWNIIHNVAISQINHTIKIIHFVLVLHPWYPINEEKGVA